MTSASACCFPSLFGVKLKSLFIVWWGWVGGGGGGVNKRCFCPGCAPEVGVTAASPALLLLFLDMQVGGDFSSLDL